MSGNCRRAGVSSLKSLIYTSPSPPHPYNNPIFSYLGLAFGPKTPWSHHPWTTPPFINNKSFSIYSHQKIFPYLSLSFFFFCFFLTESNTPTTTQPINSPCPLQLRHHICTFHVGAY